MPGGAGAAPIATTGGVGDALEKCRGGAAAAVVVAGGLYAVFAVCCCRACKHRAQLRYRRLLAHAHLRQAYREEVLYRRGGDAA